MPEFEDYALTDSLLLLEPTFTKALSCFLAYELDFYPLLDDWSDCSDWSAATTSPELKGTYHSITS